VGSRRFEPSGPLRGALRPPPDKSISHRAVLLGAMGDGETPVSGALGSDDTDATLRAVAALGAGVESEPRSDGTLELTIGGIGLRGPGTRADSGEAAIDVGNAGTLLRLLPGWLAGQGTGAWVLDGDESIRRRPVDRVAEPLTAMGATVSCRDGRLPPLRVEGAELRAIEYRLPVASAQVKSCVLLAGLLAAGDTAVIEPAPTRDHTERMLVAAGVRVDVTETTVAVRSPAGRRIVVRPPDRLELEPIEVPGDISSAAFPIVAALLVAESRIRVEGVGLNPTRIGLLGILHRMGAGVEVEEDAASGGEPRGTVLARHGPLRATRVGGAEVPLAIDELPLVGLLGCFADGETVVEGAEELRHKESDRIAAVVEGLRGLGAEIEERDDGFAVEGRGELRGGRLDARRDHRLAMLGAIAGLASREGVEVEGIDSVAVSYPRFEPDLEALIHGWAPRV
jgi:3-phosphoshikimate 1-carboxyvinyltransferase